MAPVKMTGIGAKFYAAYVGSPLYDFSGDISQVGTINKAAATVASSGIDATSEEDQPGRITGSMAYTAYFNADPTGHHTIMRNFRSTAAQLGTLAAYLLRPTVGYPMAFGQFKQMGYHFQHAENGALTVPITLSPGGIGPDWGYCIWTGVDVAGTVHTGFDLRRAGPDLTITANTLANPTVVTTSAPHGLVTGDTVFISGTNSTPIIDGDRTVTVITPTTFSVPVSVSGAGTAGSVYRTSSHFGLRVFIGLRSLVSGTMVPTIEDSADNTTFAAVTGMTGIAGMTAADGARLVLSSRFQLIRRYVRVSSTGTFGTADWFAGVYRPASAHD